jgi:hypothetical protein
MEDEFDERETKPKYESSNPNFPLSVELHKLRFKPDPPKQPTRGWRLVRGALIGVGFGIAACVIENSGSYFLPVFGVVMVLALIEFAVKSK